ncbi:hypothetical protein CP982_01070 [Streptomyces spectabilis]|uniref:Uncharacterized protein n=1 Tax=Streptomyces spectabilis TaxID=68270 RepID=A0A5P2WZ95_STRST|nr:hypothetical protein CP982_01070 [Streptomyces spectabilis]
MRAAALPPRIALLLHSVTNGALVALAAGLGALEEHRHDELSPSVRWLLCASFAVCVLISLAGAVAAQAAAGERLCWGGLLVHSVPPLAVALLNGLSAGGCPRLPWSGCSWRRRCGAIWSAWRATAALGGCSSDLYRSVPGHAGDGATEAGPDAAVC